MATNCPNSYEGGCRCAEHERGLLDHCDSLAMHAALERLRPHLRVVTMPPELDAVPCDGSMTCSCERCLREKEQRVRAGSQDRRQPWEALKVA